MTNNREQLLRLLGELSDAAPELRLGQMLANLATLALGANPGAVWDAEDEDLLTAAERLLERYRSRRVRDDGRGDRSQEGSELGHDRPQVIRHPIRP